MKTLEEKVSFGGINGFYEHESDACGCTMRFAVYQPPQAKEGPVPVVTFLSGLTCTADNFTTKAGAQRVAAELGLMLVMPDTSPRGDQVPDEEGWDFGKGAGFYVDATEEPWSTHYNMHSYVTRELPALVDEHFPTQGPGYRSVFGHSMGGHGALVLALQAPDQWRSVSAFSPIVAPMRVPWGIKAFPKYLGEDRATWARHDATALVSERQHPTTILIDQGLADSFLDEQLKPELFEDACAAHGQALELRRHEGYDHSYYFIATFVEDHLRHHAAHLKG
ncbi:MAG: S-formylglutathione hydrolase [Sandaracinus sp.]|nr:S-formylglutathione hydrolase [Sandaracinus sp.]|tara:strand:- start:2439 stop:3275 length:837 start_codon:yes stop_codon:yes gene_type:complete